MKTLKKIIIWLLVLITLLIVVAYILPSSYKVERSILIKGDGSTIYGMACDFNNWDYWTPWSAKDDSTATEEIIGNCEVGAVHRWAGEEMGKGEMMITEMISQQMLKWDLKYEGFSEKMIIGMLFEPEGDDWVVTWTAEGELGYNPIYRYYGLTIDSKLGASYELGLQQLKDFCESLPDYPGIKTVELASSPAISVKDSVKMLDLGVFMETFMPQLHMYAMRQEANIAGHAYSIYYNWDPDGLILVEVGIPLSEPLAGEDMIKSVNTPEGKAVKGIYYGAYEEMAVVYEALEQYMMVMQLEPVGLAYEVYVVSSHTEADPAKFETHVYFPIK